MDVVSASVGDVSRRAPLRFVVEEVVEDDLAVDAAVLLAVALLGHEQLTRAACVLQETLAVGMGRLSHRLARSRSRTARGRLRIKSVAARCPSAPRSIRSPAPAIRAGRSSRARPESP